MAPNELVFALLLGSPFSTNSTFCPFTKKSFYIFFPGNVNQHLPGEKFVAIKFENQEISATIYTNQEILATIYTSQEI